MGTGGYRCWCRSGCGWGAPRVGVTGGSLFRPLSDLNPRNGFVTSGNSPGPGQVWEEFWCGCGCPTCQQCRRKRGIPRVCLGVGYVHFSSPQNLFRDSLGSKIPHLHCRRCLASRTTAFLALCFPLAGTGIGIARPPTGLAHPRIACSNCLRRDVFARQVVASGMGWRCSAGAAFRFLGCGVLWSLLLAGAN
jgi:hypothetical protein